MIVFGINNDDTWILIPDLGLRLTKRRYFRSRLYNAKIH